MHLPQPNPDDVRKFQALYLAEFGVQLDSHEATRQLTDLVQLYYLLGGHEVHRLRTQKLRK